MRTVFLVSTNRPQQPSVSQLFASDFIADDGESIESEDEITLGLETTRIIGSSEAHSEDLCLFPGAHGVDDAELIARSIRARYRQMTEDSSNMSAIIVPGDGLGGIVANALLWVDAELERDRQLENSIRGDVSRSILCPGDI